MRRLDGDHASTSGNTPGHHVRPETLIFELVFTVSADVQSRFPEGENYRFLTLVLPEDDRLTSVRSKFGELLENPAVDGFKRASVATFALDLFHEALGDDTGKIRRSWPVHRADPVLPVSRSIATGARLR